MRQHPVSSAKLDYSTSENVAEISRLQGSMTLFALPEIQARLATFAIKAWPVPLSKAEPSNKQAQSSRSDLIGLQRLFAAGCCDDVLSHRYMWIPRAL